MTPDVTAPPGTEAWGRALRAAELFAVDPAGLGGIAVRGRAGPVRDQLVAIIRDFFPTSPLRRLPLGITDDRLLGGLDLAATLKAGRPVAEAGLLQDVDGGVLIIPSAERLAGSLLARIARVLDTGVLTAERDGFHVSQPTRFGVVALDESVERDEEVPAGMLDRLALHISLEAMSVRETCGTSLSVEALTDARLRLHRVHVRDDVVIAFTEAAAALGIASVRAPLFALRLARCAAALAGRTEVSDADIAEAASLVLAPRALMFPEVQPPPEQPEPQEPETSDSPEQDESEPTPEELAEMILAAAQAAIPSGLLERLRDARSRSRSDNARGRSGAEQAAKTRGRPAGVRAGKPKAGARLNVIETLRAAAPWQTLRRQARGGTLVDARRIEVRQDDFRLTRTKHHAETTTIFVVDASGSSALHRLAEAKGAVELLLSDCYVRRDQVALVAFRGISAEILLEPTRSLVRAKRSLAGLPGGGGTPIAAGVDRAIALGIAARRKGRTPAIVFLTDGRANVDRSGRAGRAGAEEDALAAARELKGHGLQSIVIDTSPRRHAQAETLARALGATYLPLPYANAAVVSEAVRAATT